MNVVANHQLNQKINPKNVFETRCLTWFRSSFKNVIALNAPADCDVTMRMWRYLFRWMLKIITVWSSAGIFQDQRNRWCLERRFTLIGELDGQRSRWYWILSVFWLIEWPTTLYYAVSHTQHDTFLSSIRRQWNVYVGMWFNTPKLIGRRRKQNFCRQY